MTIEKKRGLPYAPIYQVSHAGLTERFSGYDFAAMYGFARCAQALRGALEEGVKLRDEKGKKWFIIAAPNEYDNVLLWDELGVSMTVTVADIYERFSVPMPKTV